MSWFSRYSYLYDENVFCTQTFRHQRFCQFGDEFIFMIGCVIHYGDYMHSGLWNGCLIWSPLLGPYSWAINLSVVFSHNEDGIIQELRLLWVDELSFLYDYIHNSKRRVVKLTKIIELFTSTRDVYQPHLTRMFFL